MNRTYARPVDPVEWGHALFDGKGAKRLGMPRDANPFPDGPHADAWDAGWLSILRWRQTDFRQSTNLSMSPRPRECPERPNRSGPND